MFENRILFLTLQVLVSFTDSQILLNQQPRSYKNYDQRLHESVKQYPIAGQPLTLQAQIQSISAAPKYTAIPNENIPPNKIVSNPIPYSYDNILNNYENTIRKYESMNNNPNVVNNYYIIPPETYEPTDFKNRHIKYNDKVNRNKGGRKRRKMENYPSNDNKENKRRYYRHDDDDKRKRNAHKAQGDVSLKSNESKRKHQELPKIHENDLNESDEIEKIIREELDKVKQKEKSINQKEESTKNVNEKETRNLGEKEKFINFDDSHSAEDRLGNRKYSDVESRKTRNLKPVSTVEYQTKYTNPQDDFNKYLQYIMNGNLSYPYHYTNDMFPYNFDSFYKTLQNGETMKPKNKNARKRKNTKKPNQNTKRRNQERNKEDECNTVIELTPTYYESTPITISTGKGTPKDIYLNLKIKKNDSPFKDESISTTESHILQEDEYSEPNIDIDEALNKPLTITLYEPIEDNLEYFPDFTLLNHAYLTSSEEEELFNLQNNHNNVYNDWDYYADKVKSYVGQSNKKQSHNKPHAGLENPDFLTAVVSKKDKQPNNKNVETIFAPSRVVSYSQPAKMSHSDSEEVQKNLWCKDGDTTVVYARSIDQ